jgi:UTP--glucose-1-phosphate uridylyltransferase
MPRVGDAGLREAEEKMLAAGESPAAVAGFRRRYERLEAGDEGLIREAGIEPVAELPGLDALDVDPAIAQRALERAVVVKVNGGLGTSMGLRRTKSLLEVKEGRTFLDVIAAQVLALRARHGARLPLVLMDSFHTREDSLAALAACPSLAADVPPDFLQSREPKLTPDQLRPVRWPPDPALEWCPPGHGDVYPSLGASGVLDALLERGYAYAFLSNADNLGAVVEPRILGWMAGEGLPFVSEQCPRTPADHKGGHLGRLPDGRLVLRETAQTPPEERALFEDPRRHPFFNTNNLWVALEVLRDALARGEGALDLPLIVNAKTVDPSDGASPPVLQLETAMGAAVGVFDGARAVRVARGRFVPVKTTEDLLAVRSDAYELAADGRVAASSARRSGGPPIVELDPAVYRLLAEFERRFPGGPPSLVACERLVVRGDVTFGRDVVVRGRVELSADRDGPHVPAGAVLGG